MSKAKAAKKATTAKKPATPKTPVQEALEVTWVLKGQLKRAQMEYLRIAGMLVHVRDEKLYAELHHPDMEDYAAERLNLGRASLYRYLQVYDWVSRNHKEWLEPKPEGFIPDLADATELIWIEGKLTENDLAPSTRTELESLQAKALTGKLPKGAVSKLRGRRTKAEDGLKAFLSSLRTLRRRGAQLTSMPPEAIVKLDAVIEVLEHEGSLAQVGIALVGVA